MTTPRLLYSTAPPPAGAFELPARLDADVARSWFPELGKRSESWTPRSRLGMAVLRSLPHLPADLAAEIRELIQSVVVVESSLAVRVLRGLGLYHAGELRWTEVEIERHGIVSRKVVTDTGVGFVVDAFQNLVELENMKFHALGTGTNNEAAGDSALQTELTTEYTGNVRATGTTAESAANAFQSVGTNTLDSGTPAITEHGLMSQAATGGGVLFDRSKFSAINLVGANGDALQTTYTVTFSSGG